MDRKMSEIKLDMLFHIFGISIKDHEEELLCLDFDFTGRRHIIASLQKDIEIGILNERQRWYLTGKYDNYDVLRETINMLKSIDRSETFTVSTEKWHILTQRRSFGLTLERCANGYLKDCHYLPDFKEFDIVEFSTQTGCGHRIIIRMGNGVVLERVMKTKQLGTGYYSRLVFVLLDLFEEALEVQEEINRERQLKYMIRIQLNSFYGLGADFDGDTCVIMQRGRGSSKSLTQLAALNRLLKNGVSKIQIAPGKPLKKVHDDILDTYGYFMPPSVMRDCTAAMVKYADADVNATISAWLQTEETEKQVILEQLEYADPHVPIEQFGKLATKLPNNELEILIETNKEDKTMMIPVVRRPEIKEVIFNDPATIVFWKDGTKTVVKCSKGEKFDPEKAIAIALAKKMLYSKDYSRIMACSDEWKKSKEIRKKVEAKKKAKEAKKKAEAKKKPMPKLPVNPVITKSSTVKKTAKKGAK